MSGLGVADSYSKTLLKVGGVASWIFLGYSLLTVLLLVTMGGQPKSAQEGFAMLQDNRLIGLLRLDVLTIGVMPLYYVLFLAFDTSPVARSGLTQTFCRSHRRIFADLSLRAKSFLVWER